jgi:hypothetical protein
MKNKRREQKQKEYVEHVQNLRRGSTTDRHKSVKDYRRKNKSNTLGWEKEYA